MSATREILIDKATELFLGRAYGDVGTNELCRAAGVNKGTFYHFFPSKSDLLIAAIKHYASSFAQAFQKIADSDSTPSLKLTHLFDVPMEANLSWQTQHGYAQGCLVGNMSLELSGRSEPIRIAVQSAFASWKAPIRAIIEELSAENTLPKIDPDKGADIVIALIQGGLLLAKSHNDPSRIKMLAHGALAHLKSLSA